jgi:hypothetical protein
MQWEVLAQHALHLLARLDVVVRASGNAALLDPFDLGLPSVSADRDSRPTPQPKRFIMRPPKQVVDANRFKFDRNAGSINVKLLWLNVLLVTGLGRRRPQGRPRVTRMYPALPPPNFKYTLHCPNESKANGTT